MDSAIWTEKYRPQEFSEMRGQEDIIKRVRAFIEQKNMPHLLFAGPAGVGKSTLALIIAKKFFGHEWRQNFLELNASDERGIDVIRNKVKDFARTRAIGDVPYKIIFLDECDALTREAQQALRRTMENYTTATRFVLSCNYSSRIIEPIQSRCAVFRFKPLEKKEILALIERVSKEEHLKISEGAKEALANACEGDCRRLVNLMQSAAAFDSKISEENIYQIASLAQPKEIKEILEMALVTKFVDARNKLLEVMLNYGLSGLDIIKQIQKEILELKEIDGKEKMKLIDKCGEIEFRLTEGSDEFVQLECLLANFGLINSEK